MDSKKTMSAAYHKELLIGINEDSIRARKLRVKSTTPVKTTSRVNIITNQVLEKMVPDSKYADYHGSTRNDMMSLVEMPNYDNMWSMKVKDKNAIYMHADGNRRVSSSEACGKSSILKPEWLY